VDVAVGMVGGVGHLQGRRVPVQSVPGVHDTNAHTPVADDVNPYPASQFTGPCEQFTF
jgi:hypothetical protein